MPRILPRLRKALFEDTSPRGKIVWNHRPRKKKSLHRPMPPQPSFKASDYDRSILLSPGNPITNSNDFIRHKSLPPRPKLQLKLSQKRVLDASPVTEDVPREMTNEERRWWADPYLRMIGSPIRKCILTDRYLPSDFMIRLAPMNIPKSRRDENPKPGNTTRALIPDGLEHPRFKPRKSGRSAYILCWKEAISQMIERESHRRILPKLPIHPYLPQQIEHLLRVRILQEFCLLSERLQSNPRRTPGTPMALRRLTRKEWNSIKTTNSIPWPDSIAVIVLPPLNRDPATKQRPTPCISPSPSRILASSIAFTMQSTSALLPLPTRPPPPPISQLIPVHPGDSDSDRLSPLTPAETSSSQAHVVPLYNGVTLFPNREQRAALYQYLASTLKAETRQRSQSAAKKDGGEPKVHENAADDKASHAFLLVSNGETSKRADVAAVAAALWRLRLFNGAGWEKENTDHWVGRESRKRPE